MSLHEQPSALVAQHIAHKIRRAKWAAKAVPDDGIDLRRRFKTVEVAPKALSADAAKASIPLQQAIFEWNCQQYFNACFAPYVPPNPTPIRLRITVDMILRMVGSRYGISVLDICSSRRTAKVVRPRQVAMWLAKTVTPQSYPEIGRRFGGRDHTTILRAVQKIERLRAMDESLQQELSLFLSALRPTFSENGNAEDPARISG